MTAGGPTAFLWQDDALARVLAFARRHGRDHAALALHAAVPLGLTPELLHLIRVNCVRRAPWIAEADLLLSPLCQEVGGGFYQMDRDTRDLLVDELRHDPAWGEPALRDVAGLLHAYVERNLPAARSGEERAFLLAQEWAALAYLRPAQAAEALAAALARGLTTGDRKDALRVASVTRALAAPLTGTGNVLLYAAGLEHLAAGDTTAAARLFDALGPRRQAPVVGSVVLPPAEALLGPRKAETPAETGRTTDAWREDLSRLLEEVQAWWARAPALAFADEVASRVWARWLEPGQVLDRLLAPVRSDAADALAAVRTAVARWSDSTLEEESRRTAREMLGRRVSANHPVTWQGLRQLQERAREAVVLAGRWVSLHDARPRRERREETPEPKGRRPAPAPAPAGPPRLIALVGARASGKTCLVAALLHQVREELSRETSFRMALAWKDDASQAYAQMQERRIRDNRVPDATPTGMPSLLEFTLSLPARGWWRRLTRGGVETVPLGLLDPSGDFLESDEPPERLRAVAGAQAILLTVDPSDTEERHDQSAEILQRLVHVLRRYQGLRPTALPTQPLAVVLTKCDHPGDFFQGVRSSLEAYPTQGPRYDPRLASQISEVVASHLERLGHGNHLVALARNVFRHVSFFAVSALSRSAPPSGESSRTEPLAGGPPRPWRVEEPFLWLLHQWGYL